MPVAYRRRDDVLFTAVDGEVLALDAHRGQCYGMNEVASQVWDLLAEPKTIEDVCATLVERYDVPPEQCRTEVAALVEQFRADGLVEGQAVS
jgi:hypothetical protein